MAAFAGEGAERRGEQDVDPSAFQVRPHKHYQLPQVHRPEGEPAGGGVAAERVQDRGVLQGGAGEGQAEHEREGVPLLPRPQRGLPAEEGGQGQAGAGDLRRLLPDIRDFIAEDKVAVAEAVQQLRAADESVRGEGDEGAGLPGGQRQRGGHQPLLNIPGGCRVMN